MKITVPNIYDALASLYVSGMTEHAQLDETMEGLVVFGAVVAAGTTDIMAAVTTAAATDVTLDTPILVDPNFGRNLIVTSTDADGVVTIHGRDYLNQPMTETITCSANTGTGKKAFKYVDRYVSVSNVGDFSLGSGEELGLPFVVSDIISEYANGVPASAPTHVVAVTTDPATATTGDVRGTVTPTTTMNGSNSIEMKVRFDNTDTYGLYGVAQA